jgi:glycosyltransferase involved in cell wall biosynthesis
MHTNVSEGQKIPGGAHEAASPYVVSAVIATRNRPALLCRAVESVLRQTCPDIEIIVVIDGHDPVTAKSLERFARYPHLRIEHLFESVGGGEARNIGVRMARGRWVGFLDDDDEWLESKVQVQLECAREVSHNDVVVVSHYFVRRGDAIDMIRPRRIPLSGEPFSEYLFKPGCGFQTSVFFSSKELLIRIPFTKGLRKHQDWDWLLRAVSDSAVTLRVSDQALAVWYDLHSADRVSSASDWEFSLSWLRNNTHLFTRRAFSAFVAKVCLPAAMAQGAGWRTRWKLAKLFLLEGTPSVSNAGIFGIKCILSRELIHRWRDPVIVALVRPSRNFASRPVGDSFFAAGHRG